MNLSDKALELIIRDVLSGMEEFALGQGYGACLEDVEILGTETRDPGEGIGSPPRQAVVLVFPGMKKTA